MYLKKFSAFVFLLSLVSAPAYAAFPDDLDDVIFIEEGTQSDLVGLTQFMRNMAVTGRFSVEISGAHPAGGQNLILNNSKAGSWPGILGCCNANAWILVNVDGQVYAATYEFMRVGQTVKSTKALNGVGHIRFPPLSRFLPKTGETYGFMQSCIVRNGINRPENNCQERTNIDFWKIGTGRVGVAEFGFPPASATPSLSPVIDLLTEEAEEVE